MYGADDDRDNDTCSCTFGRPCPSHRRMQEESDRHSRKRMIDKGINPDAHVSSNLAEILFLVEGSNELSRSQKDAISRIIFPLR